MIDLTNNDLKIIKENLLYELLNNGGIIDNEYLYNIYKLLRKLDKCDSQNFVKVDWSCFDIYIS
jgi:hypothetical protein